MGGPIILGGVGAKSDHNIYQIRLPLHAEKNAVLSGVCLERITHTHISRVSIRWYCEN